MLRLFWICALFLLLDVAHAAPTTCQAGSTQIIGPYWYQCVSGAMQPGGCVVPESGGKQVRIGDLFRQEDYQYQCIQDADGRPWVKMTGCYYNGQPLTDAQIVEGEKAYFQCTREGDMFRLNVIGCMADGHRLQLGERYSDSAQGVLWECRLEDNGAYAICAIGCVINGQDYLLGQQYQDGYRVMRCNKFGNQCLAMLVGCADASGKLYQFGDAMVVTGTSSNCPQVKRCDIIGTDINLTLVGCAMQNSTQQLLNAQWRQGDYMVTCAENGGIAVITQTLCYYKSSDNATETSVNPGCYIRSKVNPALGIGCQQLTPTTLQLVTFAYSDATAQTYNLKSYC